MKLPSNKPVAHWAPHIYGLLTLALICSRSLSSLILSARGMGQHLTVNSLLDCIQLCLGVVTDSAPFLILSHVVDAADAFPVDHVYSECTGSIN